MADLFEQVEDYGYGDEYSFSAPGHKRNYFENDFFAELFKRDISDVDSFVSEDGQEGYVKYSLEDTAKAFEAYDSYYADSNSAVLIALSASLKKGDRILATRCSRKSFYNSVYLLGLEVSYLYGDIDQDYGLQLGITVEQVEEALKNEKNIKAVYITSPSPQGISAEIDDIAELLHKNKIPLIVDAAYGTHFGFADFLPSGAVGDGADIVIHEPFRTLPAQVGTALIHINGEIVDKEKLEFFLNLYSSDMPSYLNYAITDYTVTKLVKKELDWKSFYEKREQLSKKLAELTSIGTFEAFTPDRWDTPEIGKVLIFPKTKRIDGRQLYERLRKEFHIKAQMCTPTYVLFSFSIADNDEGFERLADALTKIDEEYALKDEESKTMANRDLGHLESLFGVKSSQSSGNRKKYDDLPRAKCVKTITEALDAEKEALQPLISEGRICGAYVDIYPFIQPILVPGEVITKEALALISFYQKAGFEVTGIFVDRIDVLREKVSE